MDRRNRMPRLTALSAATLAVYLTTALPASAYIGPGLGAGAVGAVLGVIGAVFLALFAVVYYPIKRMLRRRRKPEPGRIESKEAE